MSAVAIIGITVLLGIFLLSAVSYAKRCLATADFGF